ncbi:MAG: hypothetical protein R2715_01470 [Ilumatobacteraceae bacterium]
MIERPHAGGERTGQRLSGDPDLDFSVVGTGAVGRRAVRNLVSSGFTRIGVHDLETGVAEQVAKASGHHVRAVSAAEAFDARVVVFAHPGDQCPSVRTVLERGNHAVSVVDDLEEYRRLADLGPLAHALGGTLVLGAGMSPGLSGLLARFLADRLDDVDEVHVAIHGTGGPACARQHHRSLGNTGLVWHDNDWVGRPGGSGRELCWFPDAAGSHDCYRAELVDPLVLHEAFPMAARVGARRSATRRDRLTARLPMLSPPPAEGGMGGIRVEVRGSRGGARVTYVAGVAERPSVAAGVTAGVLAGAVFEGRVKPGRVQPGRDELPTGELLDRIRRSGIQLHEFTGGS